MTRTPTPPADTREEFARIAARDDELKRIDEDRYSDAMDSAVNAYAMAGYFQRTESRDRGNGEDIIREKLAHAIMTYMKEYPESGLVRLARPPAPYRDGTTVGAQPAAQPISPHPLPSVCGGEGWRETEISRHFVNELGRKVSIYLTASEEKGVLISVSGERSSSHWEILHDEATVLREVLCYQIWDRPPMTDHAPLFMLGVALNEWFRALHIWTTRSDCAGRTRP